MLRIEFLERLLQNLFLSGSIFFIIYFCQNHCRRKRVSYHNLRITVSIFKDEYFSLFWFDWCLPKVPAFQFSPKSTNCHNQTSHLDHYFTYWITLNAWIRTLINTVCTQLSKQRVSLNLKKNSLYRNRKQITTCGRAHAAWY